MTSKFDGVGQVLLPGDRILKELPVKGKMRLGPGVSIQAKQVIAVQNGVFNQTKNGKAWILISQKKYTPAIDEAIVGIIQDRNSEVFLVDINSNSQAELPVTLFENATKRNVPPLKPGDLIHGRVTSAFPHVNPTLSCVDRNGKAAGMGVLKNGATLYVSTSFARRLISKPIHPVLDLVGKKFKFEIVVGLNGLIWIDADSPSTSIFITGILKQADGKDEAVAKQFCEEALGRLFNQ